MSTPTDQEDWHQVIEVKPDQGDPEGPEDHWWQWFRIEIPEKPQQRIEFFGIILMILAAEITIGYIIGIILRSIFGWPF